MTKKFTYTEKATGDRLDAVEWNNLAQDVDAAVDAINNGALNGGSDPHLVFDEHSASNPTGKSNLTLQTTAEDQYLDGSKTKGGKINIEPISDLQIKAGDDISFYAHHRDEGNKNQVLFKVLTETNDETEIPANIKINSGDITITNKDSIVAVMVEVKSSYKKTPDYEIDTDFPANTFTSGNIYKSSEINSKLNGVASPSAITDILNAGIGKTRVIKYTDGTTNTFYKFTKVSNADGVTNVSFEDADGMGYLKVRAQAIDLRCEDHGGIALQPKGLDGDDFENKIKFEHGGGDGLEFGTFNTLHTSLYTNDYRFKKDGVIRLANRYTEVSDKADANDSTTAYKYKKNNDANNAALSTSESKVFNAADDFYDFVETADPTCTWEDIVTIISELKTMKTNNQGPWAA